MNKNIVIYCDEGYHELALNTIESFDRVNDNFTFYYFTIDFIPTVDKDNVVVCPIDNVEGIPHPQLMKPTVLKKALDYVDEFIYVDCDLIASKHFNYNSYVKHVNTYPYCPLLHETAWQKPIYYWYEEGERKELDETLMLKYLGVKKRTQKWATTLMVGVNQTCKKFIKEWENICLTKDLWVSKEVPSHLEPFRGYFHIGDETPFNVLLWKKGVTNYLHLGAVLEPKKIESFIAAETQNIYNTRLEPDNPITDCIDSSKLFVYHQLKDLKFRNQILNSLTQDQSKKFLFVCSFYNNPEEHIDITFNNVLKQTHKNWILIVGDDFSSTPGFRGLLKRKVEEINDPRIIYYDIKFKREFYLYQNTFQELEYDYFFDLDSDDILHERTLELYNTHFKKYPEVTSIFSDYIKVSEDGLKLQYSTVSSPENYTEEFNFRDNSSVREVYTERTGQQMFGHARCMRKPTEDKIHIEKNCRTSTDSLFLFYNLNRGKHLHLPRRLYTYVNREKSDSSTMSAEEYANFNTNAKYYINKLTSSPNNQPFDPYKEIWLETSALSTCDFLSQVDTVSLISNINGSQFKLLQSLYPEKDIQLNNLNHPNLIVTWDNLSSNLKEQVKKVANQAENVNICKFNSNFNLNPEDPNKDIFDDFNLENNTFVESVSNFMSNYSWYNYYRFAIVTKQSLPSMPFLPPIKSTSKPADSFSVSFINGAKVEVLGTSNNQYVVHFIDNKTGKLVWKDTISPGMWTKPSQEYFTEWRIEIFYNGDLIHNHTFDPTNKKVYIHLDSKSLGDTLAWFPYIEEFRKTHNCQIICSTFRNHFFKPLYPEIQFITPGEVAHGIYAQYNIGWFFDSSKNPNNVITIPLQQAATDILGLPYKEIIPEINVNTSSTPIKGKYVTLAIQSTSQAKYWNYKGGWEKVVKHLNKKGYKVVTIDQHAYFGVEGCMNSIPKGTIDKTGCTFDEAATLIKEAEFHMGLSSGLSWLAWALGTHVVMVSSFSHPICEFTTNITRIYNDTPYSGYYNNPEFKFDPKNWHWNPFLNISTPEEWHDFETIAPEQVINEINKIL